MTNPSLPTLAILGGTGGIGTGLARRWAQAGYRVIIGSRELAKAQAAADDLRAVMRERGVEAAAVEAMENLAAAAAADIAILTVPFKHQIPTLEHVRGALKGKILIDVTVPLAPPAVARVQLPAGGSAGRMAQALLGGEVRVVSAFQNVAAQHLRAEPRLRERGGIDCDVLVCGDSKEACAAVIELAAAAGLRGFHGGPIDNAAAAEALTSVLININRRYKCHAGIAITGLPDEARAAAE